MAAKIRVGFMGAGWPCQRHAEGFGALKGVELAAVSEPDEARRSKFVQSYGKMQEYSDYKEMLRKASLDVAVIGLPTGMHYVACVDSLKAGCHVLCEKPPTTSASDMIKIAALAHKTGLTYMFGRQPRFAPESLEARKLVVQGKLGDIYHAESKWIRTRGIPWGAGGWFVNKAKGGGVLLDLGIHAIDSAWFVMGCPRPVEVFAGLHCAFSYLAPKGIQYNAEDAAIGLINFDNGMTLNFMTTFALNTMGRVPPQSDESRNEQWREVSIYGTKGGVEIISGKLASGEEKSVHIKDMKKPRNPVPIFTAQAKEFVRAIREKDTPLNSAEQAVMLMQMLDALRKSGETRRAVRIRKT